MTVTAAAIPAPAGRGPGRPRNDDIDGQILAATLALVDENETPTVTRIVERSGVSRAALYRRWPSITALVAAAVDAGREKPSPIPLDGDLREAVLGAFLAPEIGDGPEAYPEARFRRRVSMAMADRELQQVYWDSHVSRRRVPIEDALRTGIERGVLRADLDVEACFDLLAGVFYYQSVVRGESLGAGTARTRCAAALEVAWRGMCTDRSVPVGPSCDLG
ncbi:TetR/AcrR family transcriptional regulator [Rhodococcus phenolicus]|uniref:TetR/AcrR family transcriptional regulator n=1 Tax=Rhodococcus phenolicus TaxID=263849 RepID=UPI0009EDC550|nr:TetR/AcrR family transcriptional regulator [Rhodococcus phenolicus]